MFHKSKEIDIWEYLHATSVVGEKYLLHSNMLQLRVVVLSDSSTERDAMA